jgi:phosphoglycerate dehydrogenase-like enzyme
MQKLQIALERRVADQKTLTRISELCPHSNTALFAIGAEGPSAGRLPRLLQRLLPSSVHRSVSKLENPSPEAQALRWINPPALSSDITNVLLFPPMVDREIGKKLVTECRPAWVHSIATGVDRIPSLPAGTVLTSSRGVHSRRIAEFVLGLMLALAKNIPQHALQSRERIWQTLPSEMICGKRVGIVGLGSIGAEIARLAKALGMEVWGTKRKVENSAFADRVLPREELPHLLREADYVVLAVPLTRETHHLIGEEALDLMKSTACLINICRGAVVDENALYRALKTSRIRGACIDIFDDEKPLPKSSVFYGLPNLLITSYSAYYSMDWLDRVMERFFENLRLFRLGRLRSDFSGYPQEA